MGFSLVMASRGYSLVVVCGLLIAVTSLVVEQGLQELRHVGSRARAQWLWRMDSVALWHVGSPQIRDWAFASCTGRQVLYHWATREALPD